MPDIPREPTTRGFRMPPTAPAWALALATATVAVAVVSVLAGAAVVAVAAGFALPRTPGHAARPAALYELQRNISAARRRGQQVDVLIFTLPRATRDVVPSLLAGFRLTDSTGVCQIGGALEVELALDRAGLDRSGVERRIAAALTTQPQFGWATFPDEGVTLELLLETARRRALQTAAAGSRSVGARAGATGMGPPPSLSPGAES